MTLGGEIVGLLYWTCGPKPEGFCSWLGSQGPGPTTGLWAGAGCLFFSLTLPLSSFHPRGLHHLFSLSSPIVSISLKLGFSRMFCFNFRLLKDCKNSTMNSCVPTVQSLIVSILPDGTQPSKPGGQHGCGSGNLTLISPACSQHPFSVPASHIAFSHGLLSPLQSGTGPQPAPVLDDLSSFEVFWSVVL